MHTEKRYQVFISSTFRDLVAERQAVIKAVLELDHMPAGMELFPATDDGAWRLIQDVIDASDYYLLIVGGRYGSLDEAGIGFTEKEYDYAYQRKKPVIALLHQNPEGLPRDKTETQEAAWAKLESFRKKVSGRHTCLFWSAADDLKAHAIVSLTSAVKRNPGVGWVRADQVPTGATLSDVLALREQVAELQSKLEEARTNAPPGTEDLLQGEDPFQVSLEFSAKSQLNWRDDPTYLASIHPSWNEIFAGIAPAMINEAADHDLRNAFRRHFTQMAREEFQSSEKLKDRELHNFHFQNHDIDTCIVQFRALGLIKESDKKRSVKDTSTYWALTPYGDQLMVQLRALKKARAEHQREAGTAEIAEGRSDEI
jgi:hypothetical protein